MKRLRTVANERLDFPDFDRRGTLIADHIALVVRPLLDGIDGLFQGTGDPVPTLTVDTLAAEPLLAVELELTHFVDSLGRVVAASSHTVDMRTVENVNGCAIYGRVSTTQLATDTQDRVHIVAGSEDTLPTEVTFEDVVQVEVTNTESPPSGTGWARILTVGSWSSGIPIDLDWNSLLLFEDGDHSEPGPYFSNMGDFMDRIAAAVRRIQWEGNPDNSKSIGAQAPRSLYTLDADLTTAQGDADVAQTDATQAIADASAAQADADANTTEIAETRDLTQIVAVAAARLEYTGSGPGYVLATNRNVAEIESFGGAKREVRLRINIGATVQVADVIFSVQVTRVEWSGSNAAGNAGGTGTAGGVMFNVVILANDDLQNALAGDFGIEISPLNSSDLAASCHFDVLVYAEEAYT